MKILFVGNTSWSMWNFRREVMLNFKSKGHDVVVVAPDDKGSDLLRKHFIFEPIYSLSRKGRDPFRDFSLMLELYKIYKRHNPDRIFQYTIKPNLYGSVAAFFCRKKPYSMVAGMGYLFTNISVLTVIVSILYRIATTLSEKVLFLNQQDIRDFRRLHILPKNSTKALLLPGEGVDTEYFSQTSDYPSKQDHFCFIFVGRLLIDKGIREFLRAAKIITKSHPNTKFRIIGPIDNGNPMGISKEELLSYLNDSTIEYVESVADVRPYFRDADALILPTYYGEGLSRVCLESLSMGVPVIATDNRGCAPIVIDEITGLTIPQNNLAKLPGTIEKFISMSSEDRRLLSINGRKLILRKFSIEKIVNFYDEIVNEGSCTSIRGSDQKSVFN